MLFNGDVFEHVGQENHIKKLPGHPVGGDVGHLKSYVLQVAVKFAGTFDTGRADVDGQKAAAFHYLRGQHSAYAARAAAYLKHIVAGPDAKLHQPLHDARMALVGLLAGKKRVVKVGGSVGRFHVQGLKFKV